MMQTSPGRMPVAACTLTIARTGAGRKGRVEATFSKGTGLTGTDSRAVVRPRLSGSTDWRACKTLGGMSSRDVAHLNMRRMRPTARLIVVRAQPLPTSTA